MKIAIHNSGSFSTRWVQYCKQNTIPYKLVNCYDTDIINKIKDCDILMWHHDHGNYKDVLAAKPILFALEHAGIKVFPDFRTAWHFDNKVAQKYLLEAINAPLVPSFVFYDKEEAEKWIKRTNFPKVFKLRGGAGSTNVKLVRTAKEAQALVKKAFSVGFTQYNFYNRLKDYWRLFKEKKVKFIVLLKFILHYIVKGSNTSKMFPNEKGYIYFQDFIPNNNFDVRVIVINERAFAVKRMVRENDFRASGSGSIVYNREHIDLDCIRIAFEVNNKIKCQSVAFDFVFGNNKNPLIVEISYGFAVDAYDFCPGYWDDKLNWHEGKFNPQEWMIKDLIEQVNNNEK